MKSIRRSLIVYFILLMTAALGAVSWFSYGLTERSLRQRQKESQVRLEVQCDANIAGVRADLDHRLLRQAQAMANLSKSTAIHVESQFGLMGIVGSGALPFGYLNYSMYAYQISHDKMIPAIWQKNALLTVVEDADKLVADEDEGHAQEFFQLFRSNGVTLQRSESMGDQFFALDEHLRKGAMLLTESYDVVEMEHGVKVRRVTLKTNVPSVETLYAAWPFISKKEKIPPPGFPKGFFPAKTSSKGGKGSGRSQPTTPPTSRPPFVAKAAVIFIQYGSDLAPTDAKIADFRIQRDQQIVHLETTITSDLQVLRGRMMWIGLSALALLWVGGFVVIRLGLAPLSKMSEAVSKVTPTDFHLHLDTDRLPVELQPISARMAEALEHLHKAFEREKQAAADISHELRTPLAALMTTLDVALRKPRKPEEYRDILEECQASGQHMYQLVERLLTLARLDAGVDQFRPRDVDVTEIALACADLIRPLAKARGLTMRLNLAEPITTKTDPDKLRETLVNLLHNAVEYNNPEGSIELAVERVNGHIRFEVRDTGIGIKPETMEHLFKRFYRADPSRHADTPHAGLGLSIVKSYVALMGGTIKVESNSAGSAFIIELPFVAPAHDLATALEPELELARH